MDIKNIDKARAIMNELELMAIDINIDNMLKRKLVSESNKDTLKPSLGPVLLISYKDGNETIANHMDNTLAYNYLETDLKRLKKHQSELEEDLSTL